MSKNYTPIQIQKESLTEELWKEMLPLGQKSWDECSDIKAESCAFHGERGFVIQPNEAYYFELEDCEALLTMTARDESGVLVGFALCFYYMSPHHAPVFCANVDTFSLEPKHRVCIRRFIASIEEEFDNQGVGVVGWPVSPSGKLYDILRVLGYTPDDVVMEKRICA